MSEGFNREKYCIYKVKNMLIYNHEKMQNFVGIIILCSFGPWEMLTHVVVDSTWCFAGHSLFLADICLRFVRLAPLTTLNEPLAVPVCSLLKDVLSLCTDVNLKT